MSQQHSARRIVFDADPGVDDSMAILFAFNSPELLVEGFSTVFGNTGVDVTTQNALRLKEMAGRPNVPLSMGANRPITRPYTGKGWQVHGRNGLGEVDAPKPQSSPDPRRGAQLLVYMIMSSPGEITLVALGPLTNVALAVSVEPRIADNVREVVLMGGAATVPGNASPVAEANIHNDPEAARIVFHAGWPVTMVGLDVTTKSIMTQAYMDSLKTANNRHTDFIHAISRHYMDFYKRVAGVDGFPVHDSSAVAYALDPTLFETRKVYLDVETHSPYHSGQTVADWRGQREQEPNVNVCVDVDHERFLDLYRERLMGATA